MKEPTDDPSDAVWRALASPWRRRILDALRDGPRTTGELTDLLETTRHQLVVHLQVLRKADLVVTAAEGRIRRNFLNPVPLRTIHDRWLSHYEAVWSDVLRDLRTDLESGARADEPTSDHARAAESTGEPAGKSTGRSTVESIDSSIDESTEEAHRAG
jgi:DNA-binding transcriptional ArsR family regulator